MIFDVGYIELESHMEGDIKIIDDVEIIDFALCDK